MALQDQINKLREDILAKGNDPVPATYQGVTKGRISDVLREIDCLTTDQRDAVFALLDDVSPSFYSIQYKNFPAGIRFCDGATVAHVGCHFGILQRGEGKSDREGRDYWLKPLWEIGAIEKVFFDKANGQFIPGHPVAKSPYTAYRKVKPAGNGGSKINRVWPRRFVYISEICALTPILMLCVRCGSAAS